MMFILLAGGVLLTVGDLVIKRWATTDDWRYALGGILIWGLGLCCLATTVKQQNIAVASVMLVFFNIGTLALAEWYFFHNMLTARQIAGLALGLCALFLLRGAG